MLTATGRGLGTDMWGGLTLPGVTMPWSLLSKGLLPTSESKLEAVMSGWTFIIPKTLLACQGIEK